MDNLPEESTSGSINGAETNFNSLARISKDLTSPQEALAMKRCLTNCLFVPCSLPSAMLAEIEIDARSIWFLTEKQRISSNSTKISLASLIASCHTNKSSNLVELGMVASFAKINRSQSNIQITSSGFIGFSNFSGSCGCTCCPS